jgi:hypothetical protein
MLIVKGQMDLRISKRLVPFAVSFTFLPLSLVILSSLLVVISRDFPQSAFSRQHSYAGERS